MDIIGHQKNIRFLEQSITNGKLAPAYLFYGPKSVGKTAVAEYFTARLFCQERKSPCGKCSACQQVAKRIHPDVFWVQGSLKKDKIGIEQARQVQGFLSSGPFAASYKIAIIEEADNLTLAAANSFLKILEEMPEKSIVILIGWSFYRIIPTLRSRCQALRFGFPPCKEIITHLENKYSFRPTEAAKVLDFALGRPGRAIGFSRDPEEMGRQEKLMDQILFFLAADDADNKFKLMDLIANSETSRGEILENFLSLIRKMLLLKLDLPAGGESSKKLKSLSQEYSFTKIIDIIEGIYQIRFLLAANVNPRLAIEGVLINSL